MPVRALDLASAAGSQPRDAALSAKQNYFTNATRTLSPLWYASRLPLLPLFLLRLAVLLLTLLYMLLAAQLLTLGFAPAPGAYQPLRGVRALLARALLRPALRVILWCLGYWWVEEAGAAPTLASPVRGVIVNHVSGIADGVYMVWRTGGGNIVEKKNFPPFLDTLLLALSILSFDRAEAGPATRAKLTAAMRNHANPPIVVFPEGACSNGTRLLLFKSGAATALQALQPAVLTFPHAAVDPSFTLAGPPLHWLLLRQMLGAYNRMRVQWLPVAVPSAGEAGAGERGAAAFMERVRGEMARASGLALVPWGMADITLASVALASGAGAEAGLEARLEDLKELVDVGGDTRAVIALLKGFLREVPGRRRRGSGAAAPAAAPTAAPAAPPPAPNTITFEGFLHLLHVLRQERKGRSAGDVPSSPLSLALAQEGEAVAVAVRGAGACSSGGGGAVGGEGASAEGERLAKALQPEASLVLRRFFNLLDRNGDGRVGFREVLVGLALLADKDSEDSLAAAAASPAAPAPHANLLSLAFSLLDPADSGVCSREELEGVVHMVWPALSAQRLHEISGEAVGAGGGGGGGGAAAAAAEGAAGAGGGSITRQQFMAWGAQPLVLSALKQAFAEISPLAPAHKA